MIGVVSAASRYRAALAVLAEASRARGRRELIAAGVQSLGDAIAAASVTFNLWDMRRNKLVDAAGLKEGSFDLEALEANFDEAAATWMRERPDHRTGGSVGHLSDWVSRRELHRLAIYNDVYVDAGIEYMQGIALPAPPGYIAGFVLDRGRDRRDFTEDDRETAELIAPVLTNLYRQAAVRERLESRVRELERALRAGSIEDGARAEKLTALTPRELEILRFVARGLTNPQIATRLYISPRTVQKHLRNVYEKLGVRTRTAAAAHLGALQSSSVTSSRTTGPSSHSREAR